jgi:hypothetical protein
MIPNGDRQLHSTAASHDTLDALDPAYVPRLEDQDSFKKKQRFMYTVFSNIIRSTNGKNCVRDQYDSSDAQKFYTALLDAYHDQLSTNLRATRLRQELTLMKLDDKWRKSFELYLHFWIAKIQDLEGIQDKPVDDDTKRIWVTNTLSSQPDMDAAIRQAITTELTVHGTKGASTSTSVPWDKFYNMVLSNAKLLDSTCSRQTGRRPETNQANRNNPSRGNNRDNRSGHNANHKPFIAYTGPSMVMEPGMCFSPADWSKLTKSQKSKLLKFRKQKRAPASTTIVSINNATTNPAPITTTPTTTAPTTTTTNNCDIRQLLSSNSSRDSSSVPSSIVVDGRTYILSYGAHTYSLHQQLQSRSGSLIDGGANVGLSGSDVVVLSETLLTADFIGIADNNPSVLLQGVSKHNMDLSLVFSTNMPIKSLVRLSTPSPSCVTLEQLLMTLPVTLEVNNV